MFNDDNEENLNSPHVVSGGGGGHRYRPSYDDIEPTYHRPSRYHHRYGRINNNFNPTIQQVNSLNNKGVEHITANGGSGNVFNRHTHQDVNSPHYERAAYNPEPYQSAPDAQPQIDHSISSTPQAPYTDSAGNDGDELHVSDAPDAIPHSFYSYHEGPRRSANPTRQRVVGKGNSGILDVDAKGGENNDFDDNNEESVNSPHVVNSAANLPRGGGWQPRQGGSGAGSNTNDPTLQDVLATDNSGIAHITASGGSGNRVRSHKHQDLNSPHYELPSVGASTPTIALSPSDSDIPQDPFADIANVNVDANL